MQYFLYNKPDTISYNLTNLGGWVHAIENPKLVPDCLQSRFVVVNGVLPPLVALPVLTTVGALGWLSSAGGGSSSKCLRNMLSSFAGK